MKLNPGDAVEYHDATWPDEPGWNGLGILKTGLTEDLDGNKGYYLDNDRNTFIYVGHARLVKQ